MPCQVSPHWPLCEAQPPYTSPLTPQQTYKVTFPSLFLSICLYNWNSKQLVSRLSSLVTSTYFIIRLDSFIMRAVWLIFAPWCPPNVQEHGQNMNMCLSYCIHFLLVFICSLSIWSSANYSFLEKNEPVTEEVRKVEDDEASVSETRWEPVKRPHENICQFAQCKQAVTMCLEVTGSNPWIMHQLARGYCSAQPVKAEAEGVSLSVCDRGKM